MAGAGHRQARRPTDLFNDCHRDEPCFRLVFHQPLRQTEGLLRSIADALEIEIDIAIPDHTTLSRRGGDLRILPKRIHRTEPLHLLLHKVEPLVSEARGLVAPMHVKDVSLTCPKLCNDNHGRESVSCSR
jgi:hypothetical protein